MLNELIFSCEDIRFIKLFLLTLAKNDRAFFPVSYFYFIFQNYKLEYWIKTRRHIPSVKFIVWYLVIFQKPPRYFCGKIFLVILAKADSSEKMKMNWRTNKSHLSDRSREIFYFKVQWQQNINFLEGGENGFIARLIIVLISVKMKWLLDGCFNFQDEMWRLLTIDACETNHGIQI